MHGLTVAPVTLRKKASRLGDICEQQVQEWKKTCENTKQDDTCIVLLKDGLLSCNYLPHVPTVSDKASYMSTGDEQENSNRCNVTHATNTAEFENN